MKTALNEVALSDYMKIPSCESHFAGVGNKLLFGRWPGLSPTPTPSTLFLPKVFGKR